VCFFYAKNKEFVRFRASVESQKFVFSAGHAGVEIHNIIITSPSYLLNTRKMISRTICADLLADTARL
jgi:hypothetical protein